MPKRITRTNVRRKTKDSDERVTNKRQLEISSTTFYVLLWEYKCQTVVIVHIFQFIYYAYYVHAYVCVRMLAELFYMPLVCLTNK